MRVLAAYWRSVAVIVAIVATLVISPVSGSAAPTGLVASYSFDGGSGSVLADLSGNGNNGTIAGATWTTAGRNGGALTFNGTNSLVTIADRASLDLTAGMTLEAWVRPTALGNWRTVLLKEQTGGMVYALYGDQGGARPLGQVYIGAERNATGTSSLPLNAWTHLSATYDGAVVRLYVNGVAAGTLSIAGSLTASTGPLQIGGNNVWGEWFQGQIDDVRIYNRALTASELQADMTTAVAAPPAGDTQAPTAPAGLTVSGQSPTALTLSWNASTDNVGTTGYTTYRNTVIAGSTAAATRTYTFSGLACGTTYALAVDAVDAAGNRSARTTANGATGACTDVQAPSVPAGLTVSGQTQTALTLSWNASTDNVGTTGYATYKAGVAVGSTASGTRTYAFTGLVCGTTYALAVDAADAAGNRSAKASANGTTVACSLSAAVASYSFNAASGSVLADLSGNGNNGAVSGALWTSAGHSGGALTFNGLNTIVTVADKASLDLTTGMTLEAWVRPTANSVWRTIVTKETSGNLAYGLFSNSDAPQPSSIVTIGANPIQDITRGTAEVALSSWTHVASTYDGSVLRLYVNGTQVATKAVTGAMSNSAGPLQIGGNNVWSEWFEGQIDDLRIYNRALAPSELQTDMATPVEAPPAGDTQAPSIPGALAVSGQTQTALTLSWSASTDNVATTGYSTYRNGAAAGSTAAATRTYTFTGLACATTYALAVDAVDAAGNRSAPATVNGTTSACSPPTDTQAPSIPGALAVSGQTQTALTLSWSASTDNVATTGYSTYRNGAAAGSTAAATRTYTFTGLTCGTTYTLGVDAVDAAGNRSAQANTNAITSNCPAGNGSANLWVDASGGSCVRSATAVAYSDATACTWDAANDKCLGGDAAGVKGGSYGSVTLSGSNGRAAACTFTVATGETATVTHFNDGEIGGGDTGADWITVVGPITASEFDADGTTRVTLDNWNVNGNLAVATQPFHVEGSTNFTVKNSDIHGVKNANAMIYLSGSGYTFDNNDIYDSLDTTSGAIHTECIYATSVSSFTMTRNHFWSCATEDVFITGNEVATNWRVENNIFEHPLGPNANALAFRSGGSPSPSPDGFVLRNNTFGREAGIQINSSDNPVTANGFTVVGNFFSTQAPCGMSNTVYDYNAFTTGEQCGTHAVQSSLATFLAGFTNAHNATGNGGGTPEAPGDYTILSGSPLRDTSSPSSFPTLDRDAKVRFIGPAPDIGAYEAG